MSNLQLDQERQLAAMLGIATQLISISDVETIRKRIVESLITPTFGFKVAYFRLIEPDGSLEIYKCAGAQGQYEHNPEYKLPPGIGISSQVIQAKQPIAISDARHDKRFHLTELRDNEGLVGMLAVPLLSGEQAIGVLSCYTAEPHNFSDGEITTLQQYAQLAVGALSNAQHLYDLERINQVSEELASETELDRILKIIVRRVRRIAGADGAVLYPYDPDKARFDLERVEADGIGKNELLAIKNRPRPRGVSMTVLQEGKLEVSDLQKAVDKEWIKPTTRDVLLKEGIRAFIGWKLEGHQPVGTLYLNFRDPERLPPRDKLQPLGMLTYQAALAIERAREFERCKRESSLLAITAKVTPNVRQVRKTWEVFLDAAMELTRADAGNISIIMPDGRYLDQIVQRNFPYRSTPLEVGGRSIQGQVAYRKEPILIYNVEHDPRWSLYYHAGIPGTRSELTVPIYAGDSAEKLEGIINLESKEEANFSNHDLELIKLLCVHARIAIRIAGDYEQLVRQRDLLVTLVNMAKTLTANLDSDNLLQTILEQTAKLFKGYFATLQLKDGDRLRFEAVYPDHRMSDIPKREMLLNGPGITVKAAKIGKPLLVSDTRAYPGFVDINNGKTNSELAYPLLDDQQRVIAVLNVEHEDLAAFSESDVEVMERIAQIVAIALQQAELYSDLKFERDAAATSKQSSRPENDESLEIPKLSERELEVLCLMTNWELKTYEAIGRQLYLEKNTIKAHVSRIFSKLWAHSRLEAVEKARLWNLIPKCS